MDGTIPASSCESGSAPQRSRESGSPEPALRASARTWLPAGFILLDAVACLLAVVVSGGRVAREFDEGTLLALFNAAQILAIGALGLSIITLKSISDGRRCAAQLFWLFVFLGSILILLDELTEFHEKRLRELKFWVDLTSRVVPIVKDPGDLVLSGYAAAGLAIAWLLRGEFFAHRPSVIWLVTGSICLAGSMLISILPHYLAGPFSARPWLVVGEALKIFGFGSLLAGVYLIYLGEQTAVLLRVKRGPAITD